MPQENRQLIVFTAPDCSVCKQFKHEITDHWQAEIAIQEVSGSSAPSGLTLGDF